MRLFLVNFLLKKMSFDTKKIIFLQIKQQVYF